MAIVGKELTAVLHRVCTSTSELTFVTRLDYNGGRTTPAEIAALYPSLAWSETQELDLQGVQLKWLQYGPVSPGSAYATDEAAILDLQHFVEVTAVGNNPGQTQSYFDIRWIGGVWQVGGIADYSGSPEVVWAAFPDANTYNITTAAPFGTALGNGLIRAQALYYFPGNDIAAAPIGAQYPDPPDPVPASLDTGTLRVGIVDLTYIFTPVDDGSGTGGSTLDGGGDGTTPVDGLSLRCWGFSLDGHDFYVLRLGNSETLVFDLTTNQWCAWESPGRTNWRAHVGQNWIGATDFNFYDTDVLAGDDATATIWRLSATSGRDQRGDQTLMLDDKITHIVTGGIQVTGRDVIPCDAVTIDVALGAPTQTGASIKLEISDDLGKTWLDCGNQEVVASAFDAVLEWRGLGIIKSPGRLFRFTDDGATVRLGGANLR